MIRARRRDRHPRRRPARPHAGARRGPLGLRCHIFAPEPDSPAFDVAAERRRSRAYEDEAALAALRRSVDVVTYRVRERARRDRGRSSAGTPPLHPGAAALADGPGPAGREEPSSPSSASRPRPSPPSTSADELDAALAEIGRPAVLKTRRFGYDGKGQVLIEAGDRPVAGLGGARRAPLHSRRLRPLRARDLGHRRPAAARRVRGLRRLRERAPRPHPAPHPRAGRRCPPRPSARRSSVARRDRRGARLCRRDRRRDVRRRGEHARRQRDRAARSQFRPLDDRGGAETSQFEQHVRAVCGWPLGSARRARRRRDAQPDRRRASRAGARSSPSPARISTSTARTRPAPAARWGTSRG